MRKIIIALMLVLPLCFVLAIYATVNTVSLAVDISANSIRIVPLDLSNYNEETRTLTLDKADLPKEKITITAEVGPANASNKEYVLYSSSPEVVGVDESGVLTVGGSVGTATVTARSKDGNFSDSISVNVISTKPYDCAFALTERGKDEGNLLTLKENGDYRGEITTGTYAFRVNITPAQFTEYEIRNLGYDEAAVFDSGAGTVMFPFGGIVEFELSVPNSIGNLKRRISLAVEPDLKSSSTSILVNGMPDFDRITLATGSNKFVLYVEAPSLPSISSSFINDTEIEEVGIRDEGGRKRYKITAFLAPNTNETFECEIEAGGKTAKAEIDFAAFDFDISADRRIDRAESRTCVILDSEATFFAVPSVGAFDVSFVWTLDGMPINGNGECKIVITQKKDHILTAKAVRDGATLREKSITVEGIERLNGLTISNKEFTPDAMISRYTVAGKKYFGDELAVNRYKLNVITFTTTFGTDLSNVSFEVSDEDLARITVDDGKAYLIADGEGKVELTAKWKGNKYFDSSISYSVTVNVVGDAVEVADYPSLRRATENGQKVVLAADIMLGTDESGKKYDAGGLREILSAHRMKSTYNIEWYKQEGKEDDAYVSYVMEFENDVYGNGHTLDANNFTAAKDGAGQPAIDLYRGPLKFVSYGDSASVAGQDNCAFLIRTDGVTLYGVNLLGCSDVSLQEGDNAYLNFLDKVGTTLEINADAKIINCKIRNGRNVVRVYGGNRDGKNYFIDKAEALSDEERINVTIDGCIISQGREFLIKAGTNKAIRASATDAEPPLIGKNGGTYVETSPNRYDGLYKDKDFYDRYVVTDLTVKDSVLEKSGLFSIGVETNFAGDFLRPENGGAAIFPGIKNWQNSGGTSYAAVVRLVGDVRLYDWKPINLLNSDTLIESPSGGTLDGWLNLDIRSMIDFVYGSDPDYSELIDDRGSDRYVHGGIAFYGGGRNYSQLDLDDFGREKPNLFNVNISVLANSDDIDMQNRGNILPKAAGTRDFNFYMYGKSSENNYDKQSNDVANDLKYGGLSKVSLFE